MFENLTGRLSGTVKKLRGQARLTEENIESTLREVRMALLEADVALPVVREFVDRVKQKALGEEVLQSLSPGQSFIKIVHDELVHLMGDANEGLTLAAQPPVVILVAGLQGSGKTTSVAKLSRWLSEQQKKSVAVTSCDVYRPAAIDQLRTLAQQVGAEFIQSESSENPVDIAKRAVDHARKQFKDVLLIDTAGRLHVDEDMMQEISALHAAAQPAETLFVVDSMSGQDAAVSAQAFNDTLPLTGVVLTKADGDARGGAALSVREITGKPIKFIGTGEKVTALEPFHPERIASRILGMGDVVSLVEKVEQEVDKAQAQKLARKIKKGRGFDLVDLKNQLEQMMNMGGLAGLVDKIPGTAGLPKNANALGDERMLPRMIAIISSMTPHERRFPDVIKNARKRRIAAGSGTQVQDVNRLLKQHLQMKKMMKKASRKGGMQRMMQSMQGKMPPPH
ncbi:MAG: signal recognition particle protein [Gammaproteobacteria bacterium]|nr:signal recognition particle protein [Gammaproteobacteria bacterium]